ncbi:39S ribosomal protein L1, mitochondrial [Sapajus apella]|uniref:Large ribosomal subunit protein uL1m n=1 Tax=Sapajus apella TaxID=9515 RepID=A0A6J3ET63_SAPAP|nr:39S ribosomal protein L1, mitochondrial [Sapajus apella]
MAAAVRCVGRALMRHQRHSLFKVVYQTSLCPCSVNVQVPNRHFAAATKPAKKKKKVLTQGLSHFLVLKDVEPFTSVVSLPYPFASEIKKVAVFTGNASEVEIAEENGAAFAGGTNLIRKILDDEIVVDFYVAVPEIMPELSQLRKKLNKRFPKFSQNSIGRDIPKMLEFFKNGHEIKVDEERENFLQTRIATLDMSSDQIAANLQAVINEVCRHRPLSLGPFVIRAFLRSSTSEGLLLKIDPLLPKEGKNEENEEEDA